MKIDTSTWKQFVIGELFELESGKVNNASELIEGNDIAYVGAKKDENGIMRYVARDNTKVTKGNCIVFICDGQGSVGFANYMNVDFIGTVNVVAGYNESLNAQIGLFIATVFSLERKKYSFGRKLKTALATTTIKLPATLDGKPDWQWMEDYIDSLHSKPLTTKNDANITSLDAADWKEFEVQELFNVVYGVNLELVNCIETDKDDPEAVAFVSRTESNNGVSAYVKPVPNIEPQPKDTITVAGGGSVLATFLQTQPFYSGRDLYLLYPKESIPHIAKLFIVTVIKANKYRYNYGRQANVTLPRLRLRLPTTPNGKPDWQWMESYIKSLPYGDRI
jgi:hypothetical protein